MARFMSLLCCTESRKQRTSAFELLNPDDCAYGNHLEKCHSILRTHANTPIAGRSSDEFGMVGAVDVDKAIERIRVVRVKSVQAQDASDYQVIIGQGSALLPLKRKAGLKDGILGQTVTNFFRNQEPATRCAQAAGFAAKPARGRRDGKAGHYSPLSNEFKRLPGGVDQDEG